MESSNTFLTRGVSLFVIYITKQTQFTNPKEILKSQFWSHIRNTEGARGGGMVEALRYKPEGRGIDSRWCH
jgi:hypothetical protein